MKLPITMGTYGREPSLLPPSLVGIDACAHILVLRQVKLRRVRTHWAEFHFLC